MQSNYAKKRSLEKSGKLLVCNKMDDETQKLTKEAMTKECEGYYKFGATWISEEEAQQYVEQGSEELRSQFIITDKNEHMIAQARNEKERVAIQKKLKARLVDRGDLQHIFGRTDSPTADKEGMFIMFSFASSRRLKIRSADLDHGYFQGERLSKLVSMRQPKEGIPDLPPDARILSWVPVYGTKDAGRGLWRRMRSVFLGKGFVEHLILSATYTLDNVVYCIMNALVDDILLASEPAVDDIMNAILQELIPGTIEETNFKYRGVEIAQLEDFSIRVTCKAAIAKLDPISIPQSRANQHDDPCTKEEQSELWSVTGSLMWIARSCV